jgi:RNA polymerase sigma-70 factor (ECF subfamily)
MDGDNPAAAILEKIDQDTVRDAIDRLSDDYRTVAIMHYLTAMPYEEIALALDIPIGTVRSRLHRARKQLQVSLWQLAVDRGLISEENN